MAKYHVACLTAAHRYLHDNSLTDPYVLQYGLPTFKNGARRKNLCTNLR